LWLKKHPSMVLTCDRDMSAFFGRGEFYVFHCMLCRFVSGSYWKHHVSSPVMTQSNISALRKRSDEMWIRHCFWSCVKIRGIIFAGNFSHSQFFLTVGHTVFLFIFSSSVLNLTPNLRSERTKFRILSTFASVLCVCGCPLLGSFSTSSPLPWTVCVIQKHSISS